MRVAASMVTRVLGIFLAMASVSAIVAAPGVSWAQAPDKEFTIAVGETLTFSGRGVSRVTVGLDSIASVKPTSDNRQVLVTGLQPGVTTINFYSGDGQKTLLIRVVPVNPTALAAEVREVLGERSGVDVRVVKGRVLLEGEVASETFKKRIERLVTLYPSQVLNFTTFRESFVEGAKMVAIQVDFIQLSTTSRDSLGANWGQFFGANLTFGTGDVPLYYSQANAGQQAQLAFGPGLLPGETNPNRLPPVVELTGGNALTSYFSLVGNLNLALDFLVENGLIKTIQNGVLITEAGTEGEFHTGGTLLIEVASLQAVDIVEKDYGLRVKVKPVVDIDNRVKLSLEAIYSELDIANGVNDIPALRNSEFKGTVNMQEGQSVLIAGLEAVQESQNERGWWLLGRIPILGWLFKQRAYLNQGQNNALFVTPRLYEPGGKTHQTIVRGVFENMLEVGADPTDLPKLSNAPAASTSSSSPSPSDSFDD